MAFKDFISRVVERKREKKEELKRIERTQRFQEQLEERKLSANERELIGIRNKDREKMIRSELQEFRRQESDEMWRGKSGNPLFVENIVHDNKGLFDSGNLFPNDTSVLRGKKLFFK